MKHVFIVGCGRSGTTWLQLLLAQHPEVATAQETHLFNSYVSNLQSCWDQHAEDVRGIGLPALFSKAEFDDMCRQFARAPLQRIADSNPDASVVVEKTPAHGRHADLILKLLPDAYFIHIVRDPRSVVASLIAASSSWGSHWASSSAADNARRWTADVALAQSIADRTDRYHEVHYRDLKSDNAIECLRLLFDFIGLDATDQFCANTFEACSIDRLRDGDTSIKATKVFENDPKDFYRKGSASGWREELSNSDIAIVEFIAAEKMRELGFEMYRSTPSNPAKPVRLTLGDWGDGIEWRTKRFLTTGCRRLRTVIYSGR